MRGLLASGASGETPMPTKPVSAHLMLPFGPSWAGKGASPSHRTPLLAPFRTGEHATTKDRDACLKLNLQSPGIKFELKLL